MIRTIRCWVVYNPGLRELVASFQFKKEAKAEFGRQCRMYGWHILEMKGTYPQRRQ